MTLSFKRNQAKGTEYSKKVFQKDQVENANLSP